MKNPDLISVAYEQKFTLKNKRKKKILIRYWVITERKRKSTIKISVGFCS
jgi:uncharacterized protein affecting Mg2+/Co2+ transport